MSALPRPDLPPGPHRDLVAELHRLHHRAGWPSLRVLAADTGVSHTTVSKTFSHRALPAWGTLELLVEAMDGDVDAMHRMWLDASTPRHVAPPSAPRIAGRRAELDVVRRHLEAGSGFLLVTGEAGIGKTTLVTAAARATDSFVATGHCLPLSTEVPLLPIADCLRSVHDVDAEWFGAAVAACPAYVSPTLAALVPDAMSVGEPVRTDDRQLLFSATTTLLRALAAHRRLAILVEDLHWADPATLDLLEHLLGRTTPVQVVGSWRTGDEATPESGVEWFARVRRLADTTVVGLGPLTREETGQQLRLLGADLSSRLDRIHQRSRGQPLFTEQLAAHLDDGPDARPARRPAGPAAHRPDRPGLGRDAHSGDRRTPAASRRPHGRWRPLPRRADRAAARPPAAPVGAIAASARSTSITPCWPRRCGGAWSPESDTAVHRALAEVLRSRPQPGGR